MRTLIVGPMTGFPEMNFPAFHAEASRLRVEGHEVVNPAELHRDPATALARGHHARLCIETDCLLDCDAIQLLSGWDNSINASDLHRRAVVLGIQVLAPLAGNPETFDEPGVTELADDGGVVHAAHVAATAE